MNKAFFKNRRNANNTIAAAVAIHLFLIILAGRFQTLLFTTAAFYSALVLYFIAGPALWLWHRTTLPLNKRGSLDDIRNTTAEAKLLEKYDPTQFFALEKGLFVGLDVGDNLTPVYAPWSKVRKTHMQVLGPTGYGKGVATTMMLAQSALAGECVVIFDPKFPGDEFAARVLNKIALENNIPFYLINLSPKMPPPLNKQLPLTPPQINIFHGTIGTDLNTLLKTAFDLSDTGGIDAHYRLHDREACKDVCLRAAEEAGLNVTIKDLVAAANKSRLITDKEGKDFKIKLKEIADLAVLNTTHGPDIPALLDQNAILYIIGNTLDEASVRVQKMLLLRILQLIDERDRTQELRPVAIMLDELKYILSTGVIHALATVRDKSCHVMLAHQTNEDLRSCGGLDPDLVTGVIKKNTTLKLIYKCVDKDDAEWAADLSGTIVVQQKSAHMQQGMFHAGEGQFREMERYYITENQLKSMPEMTGMFYGLDLAKVVQVSPMKPGPQPQITPAPPLPDEPQERAHGAANTIDLHPGPRQTPAPSAEIPPSPDVERFI
jgi:hypothetical protein